MLRASPNTLPAAQGHSLSPLVKDTALILTRRAGQACSACHSIGFRAVSRFTAVVRESPLPLGFLFLDAHGNRRMFLPHGGNMLPMPRSMFPVSKVDKLRMPRRCQPVNDRRKAVWPSPLSDTDDSDSHTALGRIAPRHLRHVLVKGVNMP